MKMLKFKDFVDFINEKMLPVSVGSDTIGHIEDTDKETIDRISRIAGSSSSKSDIVNFLLGINFPKPQAEILFDILSHSNDISKVSSYLNNRTIDITSLVGKISEANKINNDLGISGSTSSEFFNFSWRTSPPMGPGEVYLSTIIKDGRRPSGKDKGDVVVGNLELEVKGPGARLVGQHGYGDAKKMRESLSNCIKNIATQLKVNHTLIDNGNDGYWNITKKEGRGLEENLMAISLLCKGFGRKELMIISNEIAIAWSTYLINLDVKHAGSLFIDCIGKDGKINLTNYNRQTLIMFFEYYYSLEKFHYFCMTDPTGKFLIIDPKDFSKFYDNGTIKIKANPSFTNGAGTQGGCFAIGL